MGCLSSKNDNHNSNMDKGQSPGSGPGQSSKANANGSGPVVRFSPAEKSLKGDNNSAGNGANAYSNNNNNNNNMNDQKMSKSRALEYSVPMSLHSHHMESRVDSDINSNNSSSGSSLIPPGDEMQSVLSIPLFESLDNRHLKQLKNVFSRKVYNVGDLIVQEGVKAATCFHIVITGKIEISAKNSSGENIVLLELVNGDFFGEGALVADEIQAVSARAIEDHTVLYVIDTLDFNNALTRFPELSVSVDVIGRNPPLKLQLRKIPFFAHVPELKLQQLATLCEVKRFDPGLVICEQGQVADGFYFIIQGRVEVHVMGDGNMSPKGNGGRVYLDTLAQSEWFGEIALLEMTRRTATVTTTQECIVLFLSRERFHRFLRVAPEVLESGVFDSIVRRRTANSLKAIPIFASLKKKQIGPLATFDEIKLSQLGQLFRFINVDEGVTIFREGDIGSAFYIVVKGICTVTAKTPTGDDAFLADLTTNDWFGETSLLNNSRCNATITAKTNMILLKLNGENFNTFITIAPEIDAMFRARVSVRTAQRLAKIPFFAAVKENKPWSKLDLLGGLFMFEELTNNHVVFKEGDVGDKFYIIVTGTVEVCVKRGEVNVLLDTLGADDWFGEIALMRHTPRTATVTCKSDCVFLSITKEKFAKFLTIAPELTDPFNALLTHRTANMLKSLTIFRQVNENKPWSKMEMLGTLFNYEMRKPGEIVYKVGDPSDKLYLLMNGSVLVTPSESARSEGVIERTLYAQCSFGEVELWLEIPRGETVVCHDTAVLLYVNREKFSQLQSIAPELTKFFQDSVNKQVELRQKLKLSKLALDQNNSANHNNINYNSKDPLPDHSKVSNPSNYSHESEPEPEPENNLLGLNEEFMPRDRPTSISVLTMHMDESNNTDESSTRDRTVSSSSQNFSYHQNHQTLTGSTQSNGSNNNNNNNHSAPHLLSSPLTEKADKGKDPSLSEPENEAPPSLQRPQSFVISVNDVPLITSNDISAYELSPSPASSPRS